MYFFNHHDCEPELVHAVVEVCKGVEILVERENWVRLSADSTEVQTRYFAVYEHLYLQKYHRPQGFFDIKFVPENELVEAVWWDEDKVNVSNGSAVLTKTGWLDCSFQDQIPCNPPSGWRYFRLRRKV